MALGAASIYELKMFPIDITQDYFQSTEAPQRETLIKPWKELEPSTDKLLKLLKTLSGLSEGGVWIKPEIGTGILIFVE